METLKFLLSSTHFPPYHLGGDAIFVQYLSEELAKRGHDVHVFYNPAWYQFLRKGDIKKDSGQGLQGVTRHPMTKSGRRYEPALALSFGWSGRAETELSDLVSRLKPDVVHWHNTRGFIGRPYSFSGSSSLFTAHDYTLICPRSNLLKPGMRLCEKPRLCTVCCLRWRKPPHLWRTGKRRAIHPDAGVKVIAPSEYMASRIRREGVEVHRVLRNFVPDPGYALGQNDREADTLVYLGLLERHKGVHVLADAFCSSSSKHGFKLWIIGDGSLKDELRLKVKKAGMDERVTITGFLEKEKVEHIRRKAAAQIVPSIWYENSPLTVLEAFSVGVPVISSDIGGLSEIVLKDAGSETFSPGNSAQLSERLVELWSRRDSVGEMSRKARTAYLERFTPEVHMSGYFKALNDA
jgi:glycosyltransferase involved in cell wall biosynthesis